MSKTKDKTEKTSGDAAKVYIANTSGTSEVDGESLVFVKDVTRVRAGHPLLDMVPDYFTPVDDLIHYDVDEETREG
jgi:hypothetical protein